MKEIAEYLSYDQESASGLRWIRGAGNGRVRAGMEAGTLHHSGYFDVKFNGKIYRVHRVVYELEVGPIPKGMTVDHLDGVRTNNLISNLTVKTQRANNQNKRMYSNNSSGIKGVHEVTHKGATYWVAHWKAMDGTPKNKWFNCQTHGSDVAKAMAISFRGDTLTALVAEGADYTERHLNGS